MFVEAVCLNVEWKSASVRHMIFVDEPYTVRSILPKLKNAVGRGDDPHFHVERICQQGKVLNLDKRVDYYSICGGPLMFHWNAPRRWVFQYKEGTISVMVRGFDGTWTIDKDLSGEAASLLQNDGIQTWEIDDSTIRGGNGLGQYSEFRRDGTILVEMAKNGTLVVNVKKEFAEKVLSVETLTGKVVYLPFDSGSSIRMVKEAIERLEGIPCDQQRLIFGDEQLEDESKLAEYNVQRGSVLYLVLRLRGGGSCDLFADVADASSATMHEWSDSAPDWRMARPGLCLEGHCMNRRCRAFGKLVIMNGGYSDFDLVVDRNDRELCCCPICGKYVAPLTCAFNNCLWKFTGRHAKSVTTLSNDWKEVGNQYYRFNEKKGVEWDRLLIQVREPISESCEYAADPVWGNECSICAEKGTSGGVLTPCRHFFHTSCLRDWRNVDVRAECPNCGVSLGNVDQKV